MKAPRRQVRVFVSSDFHDMQAERQVLDAVVFPRLCERFEPKGVEILKVDPRWQASASEANSAEGLLATFRAIDECRPFFIGLVGERYGTTFFDCFSEELVRAYPWLQKMRGRSTLELEIAHAVLNDPSAARGAFFYFRDLTDSSSSSAFRHLMQLRLKDLIRCSRRPVMEDYPCRWNPELGRVVRLAAFAGQVVEDLSAAILAELARSDLSAVIEAELARSERPGRLPIRDAAMPLSAPQESAHGRPPEQPLGRDRARTAPPVLECDHPPCKPEAPSMATKEPRRKEPYRDENVKFTVFCPKAIPPEVWRDLVASAHLDEKRPGTPADEPSPLEKARAKARAVLKDLPREAIDEESLHSRQAIPQGGQITFVPHVPGVQFNPTHQAFLWEEDEHTVTFRMRAGAALDGNVARGEMAVLLGVINVANIPLKIDVNRAAAEIRKAPEPEAVSARPYRKIFASYSHGDLPIVEQFEQYADWIGDEYLRDLKNLRAGNRWNKRLLEMIDEADVFQLFWSNNSMKSKYVRREWKHALKRDEEGFVRPVYWEDPFPERKPHLPPPKLARLHFQKITGNYGCHRPSGAAVEPPGALVSLGSLKSNPLSECVVASAFGVEAVGEPAAKEGSASGPPVIALGGSPVDDGVEIMAARGPEAVIADALCHLDNGGVREVDTSDLGAAARTAACPSDATGTTLKDGQSAYVAGLDSELGFRVDSWSDPGVDGPCQWASAVQELRDDGFRSVSFVPLRNVEPATGPITGGEKSPEIAHIAAGIAKAHSLGMAVTVNPHVELEDFSAWRGAHDADLFSQYRVSVLGAAKTGKSGYLAGCTGIRVHSELDPLLDTLPDFVESQLSLFSDKRLVPADWQRTNLATTICEAPHLDFVGVDLYAPLAAAAEADAAGASADWTSIAIVQAEWTAALHTVCVFSRGFGEVAVG